MRIYNTHGLCVRVGVSVCMLILLEVGDSKSNPSETWWVSVTWSEEEQVYVSQAVRCSQGQKECKKLLFLEPFLPRNHTAGSCEYMRTTTITPRLATTQYHALRVAIWDARTLTGTACHTTTRKVGCTKPPVKELQDRAFSVTEARISCQLSIITNVFKNE